MPTYDPQITYKLSESGAMADALLDVVGTDELDTTAQTLTGAVNEIYADMTTEIGDLTSLNTSVKTSLVAAINDILTDYFKIVTYTASYTVAASSSGALTANDLSVSTPAGYTPIAIVKYTTGNGNVCARYCDAQATNTTTMFAYRNFSTGSVSSTAGVTVLYTRTWGA